MIRAGAKSTSSYEESLRDRDREAEARRRAEKDAQRLREEARREADRQLESMMEGGMMDVSGGLLKHVCWLMLEKIFWVRVE